VRTRKPCPGCGEVDGRRPADAVCRECRALLAWARAERGERRARSRIVFCRPWAPHALKYLGSEEEARAFQRAYWCLVGQVSEAAPPGVFPSFDRGGLMHRITADGFSSGDDYRLADARVLARLRRLYLLAVRTVEAARREGRTAGRRFVSELATGERTAQDYNEAVLRETRRT
jgi:hypothetical protein